MFIFKDCIFKQIQLTMNEEEIRKLPFIYESKFAIFLFDKEDKILFYFYKKTGTSRMKKEDYQEELKEVLKICLESKAIFFVADTMEFDFPITPALQTWTNHNIFAKHRYLRKCAILTSQNLIGRLALSQTFDTREATSLRFAVQSFDNIQEAIVILFIM